MPGPAPEREGAEVQTDPSIFWHPTRCWESSGFGRFVSRNRACQVGSEEVES